MEVGLIFKIAAVGILVTILSQVLKHSGREEHAFLLSGGADSGAKLDCTLYFRSVFDDSDVYFPYEFLKERKGCRWSW